MVSRFTVCNSINTIKVEIHILRKPLIFFILLFLNLSICIQTINTTTMTEEKQNIVSSCQYLPVIDKKLTDFATNIWTKLLATTAYYYYQKIECVVRLDPVDYELLKVPNTWHIFEDILMEGLSVEWYPNNSNHLIWSIKATYVNNKIVQNAFPKQYYDQIQHKIDPVRLNKLKIDEFITQLQIAQNSNKRRLALHKSITFNELNTIMEHKKDHSLDKLSAIMEHEHRYLIYFDVDDNVYKAARKAYLIGRMQNSDKYSTYWYIPSEDIEKYDKELIDDIMKHKKELNVTIRNVRTMSNGDIRLIWNSNNCLCSVQ
jgi:hypothetical protein